MRFEPDPKQSPAGSRVTSVAARFSLEQSSAPGRWFGVSFTVCPNPCCSCQSVGLECRPDDAPERVIRFTLDLATRGLAKVAKLSPEGAALGGGFVAEAGPTELMGALRAANPRLAEVLEQRHRQLKQLGCRLLPRRRRQKQQPMPVVVGDAEDANDLLAQPIAVPVRAALKPGRNAPCPCGSGRKFKKCCAGL